MNEEAIKKVKDYLDGRAGSDELFAAMYAKPGKTIEACWAYIVNVAKKRGSGCVCMTDEEVYGLAVHYYCEDDLKSEPLPENFKCLAPEPKVWLTDEQKQRVREEVEAEVREELKKKLRDEMVEFEATERALVEAERRRKAEEEAKKAEAEVRKAEKERKRREKEAAKEEEKRLKTAGMGCLFEF